SERGSTERCATRLAQHLHEVLFCSRLQAGAKSARRQIGVRNTKLPRHIKNRCIQHIRNHHARFCSEIAGSDFLENRAAVASFPRTENSNWQVFHLNHLAFPLVLLQICSINPEVEYPVSNGMRRIAASVSFNIESSS